MLREGQENGLFKAVGLDRTLHLVIGLKGLFFAGFGFPHVRNGHRHALIADLDAARVTAPAAIASAARLRAPVTLFGQLCHLFFHHLTGEHLGQLGIVLEQMKLHFELLPRKVAKKAELVWRMSIRIRSVIGRHGVLSCLVRRETIKQKGTLCCS